MSSNHIVAVTESNFEYEVIAYSRQKPVVVDFWAEWCVPCRTLGPLLESLAEEAGGTFRLAKVDVDANPNLALRFSVRSIPYVKVFHDGQVIGELAGAQPEGRLREFLRSITPSPHDLTLEKAQGLLNLGKYAAAEIEFRKFLGHAVGHPAALLGLSRCLLAQSRVAESQTVLANFPASREYNSAQALLELAAPLPWAQSALAFSEDPLEAAYLNALRLVLRGNFAAALDGLLDVLRQDKRYRGGEVRKVILGLFELLGPENPLTSQYRSELAMVLF